MRKSNSQRLYRGAAALILASVFNHFADRILGIKIEAFSGNVLQYFSPLWVLDMFLVPFVAGVLVSAIYGFGGKWLSYFPPLIVRALSYIEIALITGVPPGAALIPLGWWGFFVILAIESSALGGVIGEVMIKRTYGRTAPQKAVAEQAGPIQR
jgi:hypothetical protein